MEEGMFKLKKLLSELSQLKGRHTELVTVYIPADGNLIDTINQLRNEQGTAENIKSKSTRKNVVDALEKILQHLKLYRKTPENGVALFCGNISQHEGTTDIKLWAIEPPEKLGVKRYWCDQRFELEPLEEMASEKEVYGLLVVDNQEATVGLLKGKKIIALRRLDSIVPGKTAKGGQCLSIDSLVMDSDGGIQPIENITVTTKVKSADFNTYAILDSPVLDVYKTKKHTVYKIITKYPRLVIETSKDHYFFVYENGEITEKAAEELKVGDTLLMPEKIEVKGEIPKLRTSFPSYGSKITLPSELNEDLALIVGYFLGDGNYDKNRLVFSEEKKETALYYKRKIENLFNINVGFRYRKSKNYYELKAYSKTLVEFFKSEIIPKKNSINCLIPQKMLKSPNHLLAPFLMGFFDADGYISDSVAVGINNKLLAQQIQLALLRFGVLSSLYEYDNRKNPYSDKHRFTVQISEKESLQIFEKNIGFSSRLKYTKLLNMIRSRSNKSSVSKILLPGSLIRRCLEDYGYNKQDFNPAGMYLMNKRNISKGVFKKQFLDKVDGPNLYSDLSQVHSCKIIPVKLKEINIIRKPTPMIDIAVKHQSFIANGIFVHNSSQRYERVREGLKHDFYKEVAETLRGLMSEQKNLKGIILGGPGPVKNDIYDGEYLQTDIKKKILGIKDVGYTDEHGLEELVQRSADLLEEAAVAHEKEILTKFLEHMKKDSGIATYGEEKSVEAIKSGAVETLLISEQIDENKRIELEEIAQQYGTKVEIISRDTREGEQLFQIGGIGALLRWKYKP